MAYATKSDIEVEYGEDIATMIIDHGLDLVEIAEDEMNEAIANEQPQLIIDEKTDAYTTALATYQTKADATIDQNLESAANRIDGYIKTRYPRDWVTIPDLLVSINVDIAVYRMSLSANWRTDEMKIRYDENIAILENIRDGKINLNGEMEESEDEDVISSGGFAFGTWTRK